jgi:hypothetical protein
MWQGVMRAHTLTMRTIDLARSRCARTRLLIARSRGLIV